MNERADYLRRPEQSQRAARLRVWAWVVSSAVLGLVALMRQIPRVPLPEGWSTKMLPPLHAGINATAAVVLVGALLAIWAGRVTLHKRLIFVAMGLSVLFLLSYVSYHLTTPEVLYGDVNGDKVVDAGEVARLGGWRGIYLIVLITHISLAAVSLPFILFTFISGLTNQFGRHRRMAKWVFPVWLYVAVTGPICYWMLRPYY
jgi:putative membrane protein